MTKIVEDGPVRWLVPDDYKGARLLTVEEQRTIDIYVNKSGARVAHSDPIAADKVKR